MNPRFENSDNRQTNSINKSLFSDTGLFVSIRDRMCTWNKSNQMYFLFRTFGFVLILFTVSVQPFHTISFSIQHTMCLEMRSSVLFMCVTI